MRSFSVSKFKAHALAILKGVAETGEGVLVTKRGKPLARVVPWRDAETASRAGKLAGAIAFEEDIVSPLVFELAAELHERNAE